MGLQSAICSDARTIVRLPATATADAVMGALARDGVVIIEDALKPSELRRIRQELDPWFDEALYGAGEFFGRKTRRFAGVLAKAPATAGMAMHPLVLPVFEAVLRGPDPENPRCDTVDLNLTQAIGIEPGEPAQFLHRDEELWPFPRSFEVMANAMWALDAFTEENGATRLIPGSHLWPRDRQPQLGEAIQATAKAGSVILWLGGVLHGGGANGSELVRRGLIMSYKLGWLAPAERLLLSTPPEAARRLPERVQRLLGYQLHRPNLGWVEGQDPIRWLRGEIGRLAATEDNLTPMHQALLSDVAENPEKYAAYVN